MSVTNTIGLIFTEDLKKAREFLTSQTIIMFEREVKDQGMMTPFRANMLIQHIRLLLAGYEKIDEQVAEINKRIEAKVIENNNQRLTIDEMKKNREEMLTEIERLNGLLKSVKTFTNSVIESGKAIQTLIGETDA